MALALYDLTLAEFTPMVLADFVDMIVQQDPVAGGSVLTQADSQHLNYNGIEVLNGGEMYQDAVAAGHGRKFLAREDATKAVSLEPLNTRLSTNGSLKYNPRTYR